MSFIKLLEDFSPDTPCDIVDDVRLACGKKIIFAVLILLPLVSIPVLFLLNITITDPSRCGTTLFSSLLNNIILFDILSLHKGKSVYI